MPLSPYRSTTYPHLRSDLIWTTVSWIKCKACPQSRSPPYNLRGNQLHMGYFIKSHSQQSHVDSIVKFIYKKEGLSLENSSKSAEWRSLWRRCFDYTTKRFVIDVLGNAHNKVTHVFSPIFLTMNVRGMWWLSIRWSHETRWIINYVSGIFVMATVNLQRPGDTYMSQWIGSSLVQVMAWCLMAPSHYLNQWRLVHPLWDQQGQFRVNLLWIHQIAEIVRCNSNHNFLKFRSGPK